MGGLFKSGEKTTTQTSTTNPWEPQQGYLTSGFDASKAALDKGLGISAGVTDFTANMTPDQLAALKGSTSFGNGVVGSASGVMGAGASGAGAGLNTFGSQAADIYNRAGQNNTDAILADASKFADNPFLQGQIDSAINDVKRGFQTDVGNINSGAVGSGNINSTRAGVLEAMASDDAMDRAATISSTMRGQAYADGTAMASDNINKGIAAQMGANAQTGQYAGQSLDALLGAYGLGQQGYADAANAQGVIQQQDQAEIEGKLRAAGFDQDMVAKYMASVSGNYGGTTTGKTTVPTASPFQQILGGATSLLGAWGGMG